MFSEACRHRPPARRRFAVGAAGIVVFGLAAWAPPARAEAELAPAGAETPAESAAPAEPLTAAADDAFWIDRFVIENDAPYMSPLVHSDRHYTNRFEFSGCAHADWAEAIGAALPPATGYEVRCDGGFLFGQTIVTPDDITTTTPLPNDMPFGAHLYLGAFWERSETLSPTARHLEFIGVDLGVMGPAALGHETQRFIHEHLTGRPNPGWVNQLENEPAAHLHVRHQWNLAPEALGLDSPAGQLRLEFLPEVGGTLGTLRTQIEAGITVRYGWNLPRDFGPSRIGSPGTAEARPLGHSIYLFGATRGQVVAHDTFTDGSLFHDAPTAAASAIHGQPLRYVNSVGVAWSWHGRGRWDFDASWTLNFHSKLYREQSDLDGTGTFMLSFKHEF